MTEIEQKARQLYREQKAMKVSWFSLPESIQEYYIKQVNNRENNDNTV